MSLNLGKDITWQKALLIATSVIVGLAATVGAYTLLTTKKKPKKSKKVKAKAKRRKVESDEESEENLEEQLDDGDFEGGPGPEDEEEETPEMKARREEMEAKMTKLQALLLNGALTAIITKNFTVDVEKCRDIGKKHMESMSEKANSIDTLLPELIGLALKEVEEPTVIRAFVAAKWLDFIEVDPSLMYSSLNKLIGLWTDATDVEKDDKYKAVSLFLKLRRASLLAHVKASEAPIENISAAALQGLDEILEELDELVAELYPEETCIQRTVVPNLRALSKGGVGSVKKLTEIAAHRAEFLANSEDADLTSDDAVRLFIFPLYRDIVNSKTIARKLDEAQLTQLGEELVEHTIAVLGEKEGAELLMQSSNLVLNHNAPKLHDALMAATMKIVKRTKLEIPPFVMIKSRINCVYAAMFSARWEESQKLLAALEGLFQKLDQRMASLPLANVLQGHCFILTLSGPVLAGQAFPDTAKQLSVFLKQPNPWQMMAQVLMMELLKGAQGQGAAARERKFREAVAPEIADLFDTEGLLPAWAMTSSVALDQL